MNTLIDSSAWIEFLRPRGNPAIKARVTDLISLNSAVYTCPIKYELTLGAKPHEMRDLESALSFSTRIAATASHWDSASKTGAILRSRGLNFPALDLLIATVAHQESIPLLARDAHFTTIRDEVMPELKLLNDLP